MAILLSVGATGLRPTQAPGVDCYREIDPYYLTFDVPSMIHITQPVDVGWARWYIGGLLWNGAPFPADLPSAVTTVHGPGGFKYPCASVLDPPSVPGLALWLDASDSTTLILAGNRVAAWQDKSGNGRNATQALLASQPSFAPAVVNGRPGLLFDGTDDFLAVSPPLEQSRITVFLVTRVLDDTTATDQVPFASYPIDSGFACRIDPDMRPAFRVGVAGNQYDARDSHAMGPAPDIWVGRFDSTTVKLYRNGSQCASRVAMGGLAASGDLRIGDGDQNPFHGAIAEVIVYDGALSQADLQAVTEYLSCKYDIPFQPPGWILALESPNLLQARRLEIAMDYGLRSCAYLLEPVNSVNRLLLFHQGHNEDILGNGGWDTMRYFLDQGFSVLAFMMPLYGENPQWAYDVPGQAGAVHMPGHYQMAAFLDNHGGSYLRYFVDPVFIALNWAQANAAFIDVSMVGISGGGWTTTLCAALDPRIRSSFPVAGSLPLYLTEGPCANGSQGDHEQRYPLELYDGVLSYLDLYILAGHGAGRQRVQILNQFDPCCYGGVNFHTYATYVEDAVSSLGPGWHSVHLDAENTEHSISPAVIRDYIHPVILGNASGALGPERANTAVLSSAPNPFRTTNTITYTVTPGAAATARSIRLLVYDVRGRCVATLVEGQKGPGEYVQHWSGRDGRGVQLPAGVYWLDLRVDGKTSKHRTILLR